MLLLLLALKQVACRILPENQQLFVRSDVNLFLKELSDQQLRFLSIQARLSRLPLIAASFNTFVVSWKEAAEMNDLVPNEARVIPCKHRA